MKREDIEITSNNKMDSDYGKNLKFFKSKIVDTDKVYELNAKKSLELHNAKKQIKLLQDKNKQQAQENLLVKQQLKGLLSSNKPSEYEQQRKQISQLELSIEGYLDQIKSLNMTHKMLEDKINEMKVEEKATYLEQKLHLQAKEQFVKEIKELKKKSKLLDRDNTRLKKKCDIFEERIRKLKSKSAHPSSDSSDKNLSFFSDSSQTSKMEDSEGSKFKSPLPGSCEKRKKMKKRRSRGNSGSMDLSDQEKEQFFESSNMQLVEQISIGIEQQPPLQNQEHEFDAMDDNTESVILATQATNDNAMASEGAIFTSGSDSKTSQDEEMKPNTVITAAMKARLTKAKTERAVRALSQRITSKQALVINKMLIRVNDDLVSIDDELKHFCEKFYLVGHEDLVKKRILNFFKDKMSEKVQQSFQPNKICKNKNTSENSKIKEKIPSNVKYPESVSEHISHDFESQPFTLNSVETNLTSGNPSISEFSHCTENIPDINDSNKTSELSIENSHELKGNVANDLNKHEASDSISLVNATPLQNTNSEKNKCNVKFISTDLPLENDISMKKKDTLEAVVIETNDKQIEIKSEKQGDKYLTQQKIEIPLMEKNSNSDINIDEFSPDIKEILPDISETKSSKQNTDPVASSIFSSDEEADVTVNIQSVKPRQNQQTALSKLTRMRTRSISKSASEFSDASLGEIPSSSIGIVKDNLTSEKDNNCCGSLPKTLDKSENVISNVKEIDETVLIGEKSNLSKKPAHKLNFDKLKKRNSKDFVATSTLMGGNQVENIEGGDVILPPSKNKDTYKQLVKNTKKSSEKYAAIPLDYGNIKKSSGVTGNIQKAVASHKRRMEGNSGNLKAGKVYGANSEAASKPVTKKVKSRNKSTTAPELNKIRKAMGGALFEKARGKRKVESASERSMKPINIEKEVEIPVKRLKELKGGETENVDKQKLNPAKNEEEAAKILQTAHKRHPVLSTMVSLPFSVGQESPDMGEDFSFAPESNMDDVEEQSEEEVIDLNESMNEMQLKSIWEDIFFPDTPLSPFQPTSSIESATKVTLNAQSDFSAFSASFEDINVEEGEERPSISPSANLCTAISFTAEASTSKSSKFTKKRKPSKPSPDITKSRGDKKRTTVSHLQDTPRRFSNETPILALNVPTIKPVTKALSFDPSLLSSQVSSADTAAFKSFPLADGSRGNENMGLGNNVRSTGAFTPISLSAKEEEISRNAKLEVNNNILDQNREKSDLENLTHSSNSVEKEIQISAPTVAKSLEDSKLELLRMFGGAKVPLAESEGENTVNDPMTQMLLDIQSCGIIRNNAKTFCPVVHKQVIRWLSFCLKESQNHDFKAAFLSQLCSKNFNPDVVLHPWELVLVKSVVAVDRVRSVKFPHLIDQIVLPTLLKLINRFGCDYLTFTHFFRESIHESLTPFIVKDTKKLTNQATWSLLRIFASLARVTGNVSAMADLCRATIRLIKNIEVTKLLFVIVPCWVKFFQKHLPLSGRMMVILILSRGENMVRTHQHLGAKTIEIKDKLVKITELLGWDKEMPLILDQNRSSESKWRPYFDACVQCIKEAKFMKEWNINCDKVESDSSKNVLKLSLPSFVDVSTCLETMAVMKGIHFVTAEIIDKTFWPMLHTWTSQLVENKTDRKEVSDATMVAILRSVAVVLLVSIARQKVQQPAQTILVIATSYYDTIVTLLANFTAHFLDTAPIEVQCATFATVLSLSFCNPKSAYEVLFGWLHATRSKFLVRDHVPHIFLAQITAFYLDGNIHKIINWLEGQNAVRRSKVSDSITRLMFG